MKNLKWYWWLLIVLVIVGIIYFVFIHKKTTHTPIAVPTGSASTTNGNTTATGATHKIILFPVQQPTIFNSMLQRKTGTTTNTCRAGTCPYVRADGTIFCTSAACNQTA